MSVQLVVARETARLHTVVEIPEGPDRISAVLDHLERCGLLAQLTVSDATRAPLEAVTATHAPAYISALRESADTGADVPRYPDAEAPLDRRSTAMIKNYRDAAGTEPSDDSSVLLQDLEQIRREAGHDVPMTPSSFEAALYSCGSVIDAVELLSRGAARRAFCLTRPPGHHAEYETAMGFCFINNVAVGADYIIRRGLGVRAAIVDFDVHHGNGTQHLFYDRDDVLVCNVHRDPATYYPYHSGFESETGRGAGTGYNLNIPLPAGSDITAYDQAFRRIEETLDRFKPDWLLVSAGFDAHRADPLGGMRLDEQSYAEFARRLAAVADTHCSGRLVSVLEGGYNRAALAACVEHYIRALTERSPERTRSA